MPTNDIKTKTKRKALTPRREPYWERIRAGLYVGYRALHSGDGTWIARLRDDNGKQKYHALGTQPDFDEAVKAADSWTKLLNQGVRKFNSTVGDVCRTYCDHLRTHKSIASAKDANGRFVALLYGQAIENIYLSKLQTKDIRDWLNAQLDSADEDEDPDALRRAKVSANRNLDSLKAALNFALRERLVATDAGWKTVHRFKNVRKRRERFLTLEERRSLLEACPSDLSGLCKAMLLTAARPGELANANICDFDREQGTLVLDGKTERRIVSLSSAAISFFSEVAKSHSGEVPLLRREHGGRWNKDAWKKVFKAAVLATNLPDDVVLYSLRHAAISELVAGGMDVFLVARLAGTSTTMIDKHYGHLRHDRTRAAMDAVQMI